MFKEDDYVVGKRRGEQGKTYLIMNIVNTQDGVVYILEHQEDGKIKAIKESTMKSEYQVM